MIENIHIKNFKAHSDTRMSLSRINILSGLNGLGKSSIIQALLLLRQTQTKGLLAKGLDLNGELCSIGSIKDCIYQYAETDNIEISIKTNYEQVQWSFVADIHNLSDTFIKSNKKTTFSADSKFILFNNNFQYISAFRNGPTNDYDKDTSSVELLNQISRKEGRCELVAHFFHYFKDYIVDDAIVKDSKLGNSLKGQVEFWMREISPNINIHVNQNETSFNIKYSYSNKDIQTEHFKASNIGFGVSYVLPIVVATLQACSSVSSKSKKENNSIIIIENPEAHIHPSGQAKLMELICLASKCGVQFIIETHSDHIINGLLVGIKNKLISEDFAKVFYFDRYDETHSANVIDLPVLKGGKIKNAPNGFFDQLDKDMSTLMGF